VNFTAVGFVLSGNVNELAARRVEAQRGGEPSVILLGTARRVSVGYADNSGGASYRIFDAMNARRERCRKGSWGGCGAPT
jgi:hypothetical protein